MLSALTITEAHKKLHNKEISSVELTKSCFERIRTIDGQLHAVIETQEESALLQAAKIDEVGIFHHALVGIPFLVKDCYCEKGIKTATASKILHNKDYKPPYTATTVSRIEKHGGISIGKTNTDEFTMGGSTENSCYTVTKCPWDTTRVAGGSSGGAAASIASDETIFSLGTDTGGSIRQPAAFCGCTGMRVTYGRTSRYGALSMASSFDTTGVLTKTVEDTAIVLGAIAGRDTYDATTANKEVPDYSRSLQGDLKGVKIGLPKQYFIDGLDSDVEKAIQAAVQEFEKLGASIKEVSLPHTKYAVTTYYILVACESSSNMARYDGIRYGHTVEDPNDLIDYYFKTRSSGFGDEVKRRIMLGTYALSAGYYDAYYRKALKARRIIQNDFVEAFKEVDLLLSPVSPTPAFTIGAHDNDPVSMYLEDIFTLPQALAAMPCMSIPCGFSQNTDQDTKHCLPIGLQLTGPQWSEEKILQAGFAYQQATDWHTKKPSL